MEIVSPGWAPLQSTPPVSGGVVGWGAVVGCGAVVAGALVGCGAEVAVAAAPPPQAAASSASTARPAIHCQ
jgi:hypothetical protein